MKPDSRNDIQFPRKILKSVSDKDIISLLVSSSESLNIGPFHIPRTPDNKHKRCTIFQEAKTGFDCLFCGLWLPLETSAKIVIYTQVLS